MTHRERIVEFLSRRPGTAFDDDELSLRLGIVPRQTVNQICRALADAGLATRQRQGGKLRTVWGSDAAIAAAPTVEARPRGRTVDSPVALAARALTECVETLRQAGAPDVRRIDPEEVATMTPRSALVLCRALCAVWLSHQGFDASRNIHDAIQRYTSQAAADGATGRTHHMQFVRLLGNVAAHDLSAPSWNEAIAAIYAMRELASGTWSNAAPARDT